MSEAFGSPVVRGKRPATIQVAEIALGSSPAELDLFTAAELGMTISVLPRSTGTPVADAGSDQTVECTHAGGTQTPIAIAAGSEMTLDFNDAAAANRFDCVFHFLAGETWG